MLVSPLPPKRDYTTETLETTDVLPFHKLADSLFPTSSSRVYASFPTHRSLWTRNNSPSIYFSSWISISIVSLRLWDHSTLKLLLSIPSQTTMTSYQTKPRLTLFCALSAFQSTSDLTQVHSLTRVPLTMGESVPFFHKDYWTRFVQKIDP